MESEQAKEVVTQQFRMFAAAQSLQFGDPEQ
jgi:hypothetical protein